MASSPIDLTAGFAEEEKKRPSRIDLSAGIVSPGGEEERRPGEVSATKPPGAVSRFARGVGEEALNIPKMPIEIGKALVPRTLAEQFLPGLSLVNRMVIDPAREQFGKAAGRLQEGRWVEAAGHAAAGALPLLGPMAASLGEQAGEGDIAGAAGRALVLGGLPFLPRGVRALRGKVSLPKAPARAPLASRLRGKARKAEGRLGEITQEGKPRLPEEISAEILRDVATIRETGTIGETIKPAVRDAAREAFGSEVRVISVEKTVRTKEMLVELDKRFQEIKKAPETTPADKMNLELLSHQRRLLADRIAAERRQWARIGHEYQNAFDGVSEATLKELERFGINVRQMARPRDPITTGLIRSIRDRKWGEAARYATDQIRLNLFSIGSWTLDMVGNASELSGQAAQAIGRDLVYAARTGQVKFPAIEGIGRAFGDRWRKASLPMDAAIEEAFGQTVGGEIVSGAGKGSLLRRFREGQGGLARRAGRALLPVGERGAFTYRSTPASAAFDVLQGTPLYLKGTMDIMAKRLSATANIWRDAIKAADAKGLKGVERQDFYKNYFENLPKETLETAIREGNKAGFNRPLSNFEEAVARSTPAKLFLMGFPRWGFQFTRWAGEMLGYNPELLSKIKRGAAGPEEIGGYLAKTATGYGGLMAIDHFLYDRVDFDSMEYVTEDNNRVRLSGREPFASALWFLALVKGDVDKASAALKYVSAPGAEVLGQKKIGGLLGGIFTSIGQAIENPQNNPVALKREMENMLNRMLPGQAILSTIAGIIDPTYREGLGAGLPGVAQTLPARPSRTTGEPFRPRQRLFLPFVGEIGPSIPAIRGTPIPGFARQLDPIEKLLTRYGRNIYRGLRTPIAGFPAGEAPREHRREWEEEFGKNRKKVLESLAERWQSGELERLEDENVLDHIKKLESRASQAATRTINQRYGTPAKLPRRPTTRELARPNIYQRLQP